MRETLTYLEEKLLREIIRPSITRPRKTDWFYKDSVGEDLNFRVLLYEIKRLYERNGGREWNRLLKETK